MIGTIKRYIPEGRGYGFIAGDDLREYFFHVDDLVDDFELKVGDRVSFEIVEPQPVKGPRARDVHFPAEISADAGQRRNT